MKKHFNSVFVLIVITLILSAPAHAHVVVKPAEVNVGAFQTFTVGVPNEQDMATTGLRLVVPEGLKHVSPNVKPGWNIEIKREGEGDEAVVKEIVWTGSAIPVGQRDDFMFSAQVPADTTTVKWNAYQTYEDGSVVAWDKERDENQKDFSTSGPYSQTKIINDLNKSANEETTKPQTHGYSEWAGYAALALSIVAIGLNVSKRK